MTAIAPTEARSVYSYIDCETCGRSCKGPNIDMNFGSSAIRMKMGTAISFPPPWAGYISNHEGLTITNLNTKNVTLLNTPGDFRVTFIEGSPPEIIKSAHTCSSSSQKQKTKITREELLKTWQEKGTVSITAEADWGDIRWVMQQPRQPAPSTLSTPSIKTASPATSLLGSKVELPVVSEIKTSEKQGEELYLGRCLHSEIQNYFVYGGTTAKRISDQNQTLIESTATLTLKDGRILKITANKQGISINGILLETRMGTFKLLAQGDKFKFVEID